MRTRRPPPPPRSRAATPERDPSSRCRRWKARRGRPPAPWEAIPRSIRWRARSPPPGPRSSARQDGDVVAFAVHQTSWLRSWLLLREPRPNDGLEQIDGNRENRRRVILGRDLGERLKVSELHGKGLRRDDRGRLGELLRRL